jgi:hypothetical protein
MRPPGIPIKSRKMDSKHYTHLTIGNIVSRPFEGSPDEYEDAFLDIVQKYDPSVQDIEYMVVPKAGF